MNKRKWAFLSCLLGLVATPSRAAEPGPQTSATVPPPSGPMMLFGQFVGDWACDIVLVNRDGTKTRGTCDWRFSWALDGKAIQDVWIARYIDPKPGAPTVGYGTTLRWRVPQTDSWRAVWVSARDNTLHTFAVRQDRGEIVLTGEDGLPSHPFRWIFSDITPQSFSWRSEGSPDGGTTWVVGQTMIARRVASGESTEGDRRVIEALEHEWLDAESDRPTLERILASDFVHPVSAGVFLSKEQHINWSVRHPRLGRKARFETLSVRLYGDTAIATGIVEDTDASDSDRRRTIFSDVFVRRNGQWQAVSANENPVISEPLGRN